MRLRFQTTMVSNDCGMLAKEEDLDTMMAAFDLPATPDAMDLKPNQRVVALGDIHGDLRLFRNCLKAAKLLAGGDDGDNNDDWIGGDAILVQVGDLLDRGYCELEVLRLVAKLGRQAKAQGGAVIVLWGNHEVNNTLGDFSQSKSYKEQPWTKEFSPVLVEKFGADWQQTQKLVPGNSVAADPARWLALQPGGLLAKPLLSKLKVLAKIGKSVFAHAGLFEEHIKKHGGIAELNAKARQWILDPKGTESPLPFFYTWDDACMLFTRYYSFNSNAKPVSLFLRLEQPAFKRKSLSPDEVEERSKKAKLALKSVDADRMVVGHTVQDSINEFLDGKVWRIDIGNGIPSDYKHASCIDNPEIYRYEALEVVHKDGKEEVAVLRHKLLDHSGKTFKDSRRVFQQIDK